ncbi:replicative DNA helicase [Moraxella oblonga]|uniref:replicative DNA helicase n=1 Tax=Moraxella oblonga TaxID=200413 RepID=UPI0008342725|nr:replicative DNA helicase [Moraxella oblonga]
MTDEIAQKTTNDKDNLLSLQPPHNLDIERALLASLMSVDESFEQVETIITTDDFYGERHKQIFGAVAHLSRIKQPYDTLMVYDYLNQQNLLSLVGGEEYLMQINQSPATLFNLTAYAERIRELSVYRQLIKSANNMLNMAYHPKQRSVSEILDMVEADIFRINENYHNENTHQGVRRADEILATVAEHLNALQNQSDGLIGVRTGFEELDNKTQGLQKGDLIILAARPSMGKTTLAMNIAETVLHQELPVVMFSMEMSAEAVMMRMASAFGQIHQGSLRSGHMNEYEWDRFFQASTFFSNANLYIDARNNLPPSEVRSTCRRIAKQHEHGLGLIVVDYLQLMKVPGMENNRVLEISEISRSLKALAREMNCPVIALSQLSRKVDDRPNRRPIMSDLRDSGAIEQDADVIIFIYREDAYKDKDDGSGKSKKGGGDNKLKGLAEIIIGKNRNGATGKFLLKFIGEYTKFDNMDGTPTPEGFDVEE